jgi:hypothetical protein
VKRFPAVIALVLVALAGLGACSAPEPELVSDIPSPDPDLFPSAPDSLLLTSALSSARECRDAILAHTTNPPNLDSIEGVLGDDPSEAGTGSTSTR